MKHYLTFLEEQMSSRWNETALCTYKTDSYTFEEVASSIERFHICFELTGITKGDKIAISARNSARWAIAFLAINTYEAVSVPILAEFRPDDISSLVHHSESKVLFTDATLFNKLDIKKMPNLKYVVDLADFSVLYATDKQLQQVLDNRSDLFDSKYPDGLKPTDIHYPTDNLKELAVINYTSGTTSSPKGVMITYENFCSNILFLQRLLGPKPGDTILSMLPMAHMYGFMVEFLFPFCSGATIHFLGKTPTPTLLTESLQVVKPYLIITVPMVMEKIFKSSLLPLLSTRKVRSLSRIPVAKGIVFKKIRNEFLRRLGGNVYTIIMGGAGFNPEVERWFKKLKLPYSVGYGMTEAAPLLAYEGVEHYAAGSCGKPADRMEVRIDSEDPQHIVGEIQAKGANIMVGYFKNRQATETAFTPDGWLRTGDLGVMDRHKNIYIRGRSKNMILSSNGQNIYPEEVEAIINNQPYVVESLVVDRDNRMVALVYLSETAMLQNGIDTPEKIKEQVNRILETVNRNLPTYSKVSRIETVDVPFEKTPKMSIKRFLYQ